jgi:hypothetical protein
MAGKGQSSISKRQGIGNQPSTSYGEVTFARQGLASDVQKRDCDGNIAAGSRCDETCGTHVFFLCAPVGRKRLVVTRAAREEDLLGERKFEGSTLCQNRVDQLL